MKARLIALDIDGTILNMSEGLYVPPSVRNAIREAREDGAKVCLCSSRPCYLMQDATDDLDELDALIGCSGAAVEVTATNAGFKTVDTNAVDKAAYTNDVNPTHGFIPVYNNVLSAQYINTCIEIARKWDVYTSFAGQKKILARKKGEVEPELAENPFFSFMEEDELRRALEVHDVSCAFIFTEPGIPAGAVTDAPGFGSATVQRSSDSTFIITNPGVDKGTGLKILAEYWGISLEQALAVGNDENDIPMMQAAGVGVAVANASQKTLAAADWVAPDVKYGGAAAAIRRFVL